jgi:hypothetical protein
VLIRVAAGYGHLGILQLFQDRLGRDVYSQQTAELKSAVQYGHLAVVQWVHANRPEQNWTEFSGIAAFRGYLDVLQWLYENRLCELVSLHFPAGCGRFEVVRWMLSVEPELSVSGLLDSAEPGDNMEFVQWLHDNTDASCTTDAMDFRVTWQGSSGCTHTHPRDASLTGKRSRSRWRSLEAYSWIESVPVEPKGPGPVVRWGGQRCSWSSTSAKSGRSLKTRLKEGISQCRTQVRMGAYLLFSLVPRIAFSFMA